MRPFGVLLATCLTLTTSVAAVAFDRSETTATPGAADETGAVGQGLSAAFIMPASLALIKSYWDGAARQRAVSLWSMGSWGGSGFAALFGGLVAENVGWRWIFFASAAVSAAGMLMVRGTPESKAAADKTYRFDTMGVLTFMVTMVALQVLATQGSEIGWTNPITLPRWSRWR